MDEKIEKNVPPQKPNRTSNDDQSQNPKEIVSKKEKKKNHLLTVLLSAGLAFIVYKISTNLGNHTLLQLIRNSGWLLVGFGVAIIVYICIKHISGEGLSYIDNNVENISLFLCVLGLFVTALSAYSTVTDPVSRGSKALAPYIIWGCIGVLFLMILSRFEKVKCSRPGKIIYDPLFGNALTLIAIGAAILRLISSRI